MHHETKKSDSPYVVIWHPGEDIMATFRRVHRLLPAEHDGCTFIDLSMAAPYKPKSRAQAYELKRVAGGSPDLPKRIMAIPVEGNPVEGNPVEVDVERSAVLISAGH